MQTDIQDLILKLHFLGGRAGRQISTCFHKRQLCQRRPASNHVLNCQAGAIKFRQTETAEVFVVAGPLIFEYADGDLFTQLQ